MYSTPHLVSDTFPPSQVGPGGGATIYIYIIVVEHIDNMQIFLIISYISLRYNSKANYKKKTQWKNNHIQSPHETTIVNFGKNGRCQVPSMKWSQVSCLFDTPPPQNERYVVWTRTIFKRKWIMLNQPSIFINFHLNLLVFRGVHSRNSNMDTQNDVFWNVSPFKYGYFGYPC